MCSSTLVGVLELNCGKTYGRQIRTTKKEGRLLYGIRHNYTDIPALKAPYDTRNQQRVGTCSRYVKDKYVLFKYEPSTTKNGKELTQRPEVIITETLGDVDNLAAFCSYRAYFAGLKLSSSWVKPLQCYRSPDVSAELVKAASAMLDTGEATEIFTIDPDGCRDMDDGVGIAKLTDTSYRVTVAITHVPSFLVATGVSSVNLIESMVNTCSLYMGCRVVNMMPKHFAEGICSLTEEAVKPALTLSFVWDTRTLKMTGDKLAVKRVLVTDNYAYDTSRLTGDTRFAELFECVSGMSKSHRHFQACPDVSDSHDVVAYLMTLMNFYVMEWMEKRGLPCVYRVNRERADVVLPSHVEHLRRKVGNHAGEYYDAESVDRLRCEHSDSPSKVTVWAHITSPMRRLADLTNMTTIALHMHPNQYKELVGLRDHCLGMIPRISSEYKQSRRVSLDCELFAMVKRMGDDGSLFTRTFEGIVMTEHDNGGAEAVVYLEELSRFFNCATDLPVFSRVNCRIVGFDEGYRINDKVRLVVAEN
jgi:hypothetical protein